MDAFLDSLEEGRRRRFRKILLFSAVVHLSLGAVFLWAPQPSRRGTTLPAVVRVDLVAAGSPAKAVSPPARKTPPKPVPVAKPEPKPKPKPKPKPEKVVLPDKPQAKPKPAPKPKAKPAVEPKTAPESQIEYDDVLAQLRADAGEAEPSATAPGAGEVQARAGGPGVVVSPEVMAWMRKAKIHVTRSWVLAPGFRTQALEAEIRVTLTQGGQVRRTEVTRRSGNPWFDESVERAIQKASPLPAPPEADSWVFVFRPSDAL